MTICSSGIFLINIRVFFKFYREFCEIYQENQQNGYLKNVFYVEVNAFLLLNLMILKADISKTKPDMYMY